MRVLICSTLFPGLAGIPKYTKGISDEFIKLGHKVTVLCEEDYNKKKLEKVGKIEVFRHIVVDNLKKQLKIIENKAREIKKNFDLVIILWYKYFRPINKIFPDSKKIYVVPSVRKIDIRMINKNHPLIKKKYYEIINRFSIKLEKEAIYKSNFVVALGNQMNNQLKKEYSFDEAVILNPGVARNEFNFKNLKKENCFLVVANLDPRKGIDRLIKVSGFLKIGKIKVVGGGKRMQYFKDMIKNTGVENNIELAGPTKEVNKEMNKAKALLMASYSEGFPLIYPEALASGLPIVAFKSDGKNIMNASDEVVKDNFNGFLVKTESEMAEKIDLLAEDESLRKKMSQESLEISKKFSWKKCAEKLLNLVDPKVSVIMSVHNNEKYLEDAFNSLLNQTLENFEVLYIDDASTDNSLSIAKKFAEKDSRIKVFSLKKNIGQVNIFSKFINKANGKYITFLDGDDIMDKRRLKEHSEFIEKNHLDFSYCDCVVSYEDGNKKIKKAIEFNKNFKKVLAKISKENFDLKTLPGKHLDLKNSGRTIFGGEFMIKKTSFDKIKFDANLKNMADHDLWFQAIGKNLKIQRFPKPYLTYRQHSGQKSRNIKRIEEAAVYINKKLKSGKYFR